MDMEYELLDAEIVTAESECIVLEPEEAADIPDPNHEELSARKKIDVSDFIKNNDLTAKKDIKWCKNLTYIIPVIRWHTEHTRDPLEQKGPIHFYLNNFTEELFDKMAHCTNIYSVKENVRFQPNLGFSSFSCSSH